MSVVELIPLSSMIEQNMDVPDEIWGQVDRGAEWLDGEIPGWPLLVSDPIDTGRFRVCVIGQIVKATEGVECVRSDYDRFFQQRLVPSSMAKSMGFEPWTLLEAAQSSYAWTRLINQRRIELRH